MGEPAQQQKQQHIIIDMGMVNMGLSPQALGLYVVMKSHMCQDRTAYPGTDRIHQLTGWSKPTILKYRKELEAAGVIEKTPRVNAETGKQTSNLYRFPVVKSSDSNPTAIGVKNFDSSQESLPVGVKNFDRGGKNSLPELHPTNYIQFNYNNIGANAEQPDVNLPGVAGAYRQVTGLAASYSETQSQKAVDLLSEDVVKDVLSGIQQRTARVAGNDLDNLFVLLSQFERKPGHWFTEVLKEVDRRQPSHILKYVNAILKTWVEDPPEDRKPRIRYRYVIEDEQNALNQEPEAPTESQDPRDDEDPLMSMSREDRARLYHKYLGHKIHNARDYFPDIETGQAS